MHVEPRDAQATRISAKALGSAAFRQAYGLDKAYVAGAMYKGISSPELVVALGRAGLMGFLGTGGLSLEQIEAGIRRIRGGLDAGQPYGANLLHQPAAPELEDRTVDLYLKHGIRHVEAAAYMQMSSSLVRFRLTGLRRNARGDIEQGHRIMAKVSRCEVAERFLLPPPQALVRSLLDAGAITAEQAELGSRVPVASEVCVEADSGGHTDQGVAFALLPAIRALRDRIAREQGYAEPVATGVAGGIGTPEAAAAAFVLGADFIVTGSINQCTVEAGTSDAAKDMLQQADVHDTEYAPAGDMFELGAKVQVLRKGVFFPARASKLYDLYRHHACIEDIDPQVRAQIEQRFFGRGFDEVWQETRAHFERSRPGFIQDVEKDPKRKMALIFKWYFVHTTRLAMSGSAQQRVDYQVHCGPALGAFNRWTRGTAIEPWRQRRVADIGHRIMDGAARVMDERLALLMAQCRP